VHFPRNNNVKVHRVGNVYPPMIQIQDINHPRQLLLNFFESGGCARRAIRTTRRTGTTGAGKPVCWEPLDEEWVSMVTDLLP
jgi:hypothetical protein